MQPFDVTPSAPHNMASGPLTVNTGHRDVHDLSHSDLGNAMAGVTATGDIMVKFFYTRIKLATKNPELDGKYETRLCVAKQPKGDRSTVATVFIDEKTAARMFPREFDHFTRNEDLPTSGTPLSELPGITISQIGLMAINGLRSIEDVASITTDQAAEIGFDATRAHKLAVAWIERATNAKPLTQAAETEARLAQQIAEMQKQVAALSETVKAQDIELSAYRKIGQRNDLPQQGLRSSPDQAVPVIGEDDFEDMSDSDPMANGPGVAEIDDPLGLSE